MTPDRRVARIAGSEAIVEEPRALALRRAQEAVASGDLRRALRLTEELLADPAAPEREGAVAVAAVALAARGRWSRSAELYAHLDETGDRPLARLLSVPGLLATGDVARATVAADARSRLTRPPALREEAIALLAQGLLETTGPDPANALRTLLESAELLEAAGGTLLPDTPHAFGAVAAMQLNDFEVADHLLSRAVSASIGGKAASGRHLLLRSFAALRGGRLRASEARLREARRGRRLDVRDALLAAAIEVGIARRAGAMDRLETAWPRAFDAMLRHPVDLYALQPFGELVGGAARLRRLDRVRTFRDDADALIRRIGGAPLWAASARWYEVQAALVVEDRTWLAEAAEALEQVPPPTPRLEGLPVAARSWVQVLDGRIVPARVQEASTALAAAGLPWDAARLAGSAAVRCDDPGRTRALLGFARELRSGLGDGAEETGRAELLTDREREVAAGILAGLTHKDIGAQLFISPKTVEHHAANIRQRLGAATRAEFLAAIREYLEP